MIKRNSSVMLRCLHLLNIPEDMNLLQRLCEKVKPRNFCIPFFLYPVIRLQLSAFPSFVYFFVFPIYPPSSPHKCNIYVNKSIILLFASVSQLTARYWILLWRHEHPICGCPSLIALIMAPLCAWVDWACWLIHRTLMQLYKLLNFQTATWRWGRGFE